MRLTEILLMLLGFGSIIFLAFITTKYIGTKASKAMTGKHVTIIETVSLGMDKRLQLVKAGEQYLLIATTSKTVELISEIRLNEDAEAENAETPLGMPNVFDFKSLFEKYAGMYKNKKGGVLKPVETDKQNIRPEGDKFRNNLDKLMNITREYEKQDSKNGDELTNEK